MKHIILTSQEQQYEKIKWCVLLGGGVNSKRMKDLNAFTFKVTIGIYKLHPAYNDNFNYKNNILASNI
jgi:hypothetical protein